MLRLPARDLKGVMCGSLLGGSPNWGYLCVLTITRIFVQSILLSVLGCPYFGFVGSPCNPNRGTQNPYL